MPVQKIKAREPGAREGLDVIDGQRDQGRRARRYRAGKAEVELGCAKRNDRPDEDIVVFTGGAGNKFRTDGVCADQPRRAMLFGRSGGDDDTGRAAEIGFYLGKGRQVELHVGGGVKLISVEEGGNRSSRPSSADQFRRHFFAFASKKPPTDFIVTQLFRKLIHLKSS